MPHVALDESVRELPLLPGELDAVPFEPGAVHAELTKPLPLES